MSPAAARKAGDDGEDADEAEQCEGELTVGIRRDEVQRSPRVGVVGLEEPPQSRHRSGEWAG